MNAEQLQQMESLAKRRADITKLVNSDGWKMFEAAMRNAANISYTQQVQSSNAHDCAKFVGAHHALQSMLDWASRELNSINQQAVLLEQEALADAQKGGK